MSIWGERFGNVCSWSVIPQSVARRHKSGQLHWHCSIVLAAPQSFGLASGNAWPFVRSAKCQNGPSPAVPCGKQILQLAIGKWLDSNACQMALTAEEIHWISIIASVGKTKLADTPQHIQHIVFNQPITKYSSYWSSHSLWKLTASISSMLWLLLAGKSFCASDWIKCLWIIYLDL